MKPRSSILLILLLALGLRLVMIGTRAMWYDEAFAVLFSEKGLSAMLYGTLTPVEGVASDVHPLLYYTTLNGWMGVFGQSAAAVRLYSVLLSMVTLVVFYLLAKNLFNQKTATAALLIAAVAPFYVQYSQEARMYSLLALLLMLTTYCYVRGTCSENNGWWVGLAVCAGLAMYAQQLAGFYLVALGLAALLTRKRAIIVRMVLAGIGAILLYLPWLVQLPSQLGKIGAYWINRPGIAELLLTFRSFLFVDMDVKDVAVLVLSLLAVVLTGVFIILRALNTFSRPSADRDSLGLVLWLAVVPIALMWLVSQVRPVYLNRALLPSGLMLYLALGWLFTRARLPSVISGLLILVLAGVFAGGLFSFYTWDTFPRGQFRDALAYLHKNALPTDRIIHANKLTALPFRYDDRALPMQYIGDPPGALSDTLALPTQKVLDYYALPDTPAAFEGAPRIWYIVFDRQEETDLDLLNKTLEPISAQHFNDLTIYLFAQKKQTQ